jgi:cytosine/adenosine deaminase-related metal-dependent hydrolase
VPTQDFYRQPAAMTEPGSYQPLLADLPRGIGAVASAAHGLVIHEHLAEAYGLIGRQQVARAYDRQGRIADGVLVAHGRQAQQVIADLLARPDVELVHLRNVGYGCYNFAVRANSG